MLKRLFGMGLIAAALLLTPQLAHAQAKTFDVASVRLSPVIDPQAMMAAIQAGRMPRFGPQITGLRAEYSQMQLLDLIAYAYQIKPYQVTGPSFLTGQRFDIAATMPAGSSAADAPKMMRAMLADRFKLEATIQKEEHPVYALIIGKGGPRLTSAPAPPPLDDTAELKPGEMKVDTPDGPAHLTLRVGGTGMGGGTMNMGTKGVMSYSAKMEGQSFMLHVECTGVTMPAFAAMLTQLLQQGPSDADPKQVIDQTNLAGNYDVALDFSQQIDMTGGGNSPGTASDPRGGGTASIFDSIQKMGLKLDARKAPVEQVVVTHAEKMPTEN